MSNKNYTHTEKNELIHIIQKKEYISRWGIDLLIESESQAYKGNCRMV